MILAVDDATKNNKMQCQLMKLATPAGVTPYFLTIDEAVEKLKANAYGSKKVMVLAKSPNTILEMLNKGVEMPEVNVGNVRPKDATEKLYDFVYSTMDDIPVWKEIIAKGTSLIAQGVPEATSLDLRKVLEKY